MIQKFFFQKISVGNRYTYVGQGLSVGAMHVQQTMKSTCLIQTDTYKLLLLLNW